MNFAGGEEDHANLISHGRYKWRIVRTFSRPSKS